MASRRGVVAVVLFLVAAGCLSGETEPSPPGQSEELLVPVWERVYEDYYTNDSYSRVLENGTYEILPVESIFVPVDLPLSEGGAAVEGNAVVHMGLWRPDVPDGVTVPVLAEIGPYYNDGDVDALTPANRLGKFLIENMVPHGYTVAQVSVFGTGDSNHCMDLMGYSEQLGIDAAVTWLGEQNWSTGSVGVIGKSYDGSTPWEAATFGNPYLKTIVPISGLIGIYDLMWRNGSSEARAGIMHNGVYGSFGIDGDAEDRGNLCSDYLYGTIAGPSAVIWGSEVAPEIWDYWQERRFLQDTLDNYDGSVYIVHGMQDWNVDPHMAFPTHQILIDHGFEVKGLYGQWGHHYPDRPGDHQALNPGRGEEAYPMSVRYDWAQDLLEWFDYYLEGSGPKPGLHAEIQNNLGEWRVEATYPPSDLEPMALGLGSDLTLEGGNGILPTTTTFLTEPFENNTTVAGLPTLHVEVTPASTGGMIYARLEIASSGMHLGHAIMDLRYHQGGDEPVTIVPGLPILVKMEFFGMDVTIPAGESIRLEVATQGEDYTPPAINGPMAISISDDSVLSLPIDLGIDDIPFLPPVWYDDNFSAQRPQEESNRSASSDLNLFPVVISGAILLLLGSAAVVLWARKSSPPAVEDRVNDLLVADSLPLSGGKESG